MTYELRKWCLNHGRMWSTEDVEKAFRQIDERYSKLNEKKRDAYVRFLQKALAEALDEKKASTILLSLAEASMDDKFLPYLGIIEEVENMHGIYKYLCCQEGKTPSFIGVEFVMRHKCPGTGRYLTLDRCMSSVQSLRIPVGLYEQINVHLLFPITCIIRVGDWVRRIVITDYNTLYPLSAIGPMPNMKSTPTISFAFQCPPDTPREADCILVDILGVTVLDDVRDAQEDSLIRYPVDYRAAGFHKRCLDSV